MSRICLRELVHNLTPLFADLKKEDIINIYVHSLLICHTSHNDFTYLRRKDDLVKRTVFIYPKKFQIYITLKKQDLDHINRSLAQLKEHLAIKKIMGLFSEIGFVRERGSKNTCTPMISVLLKADPDISICAKVTRKICSQTDCLEKCEAVKRVKVEMKYRENCAKDPNVPKLVDHKIYVGSNSGDDWVKHLEISELLHRDLHRLLYEDKVQLTTHQKWSLLKQIICGLESLHRQGYMHGDIKAENVLVADLDIAKLGDFGHVTRPCRIKSTIGTQRFWAPEQLRYYFTRQRAERCRIGFKTDIWGIGWIIIHLFQLPAPVWFSSLLFFLEHPDETNLNQCLSSIKKAEEEMLSSDIPYTILKKCWQMEPENRPTPNELLKLIDAMA